MQTSKPKVSEFQMFARIYAIVMLGTVAGIAAFFAWLID